MTMTQKEYILHLEKTIKSLENQVSNLTEMVILLNKKQCGHSSEKTPKTEMLPIGKGELSYGEIGRDYCNKLFAVTYAKNQKKYMENYLLGGRCSLYNNLE